ncbi:MAG: ATP-dependent Clp protease ATP-binding subunit, partial [Lachnospiraceae bacterium]|nr:ATP-dependent Clp protease ATP-binding subunit [Lachnospiraceae bacterium]
YEVSKKHNKKLNMSNKIPEFIVKDNLDRDPDQGGARSAVAKFEEQVVAKVAKCINQNPDAIEVNVGISGEMAFSNKTQLRSAARICVNAIYN